MTSSCKLPSSHILYPLWKYAVDADQVVRSDLKELMDYDLQGAPYGYTPFCDSRETTLGFQFWRTGKFLHFFSPSNEYVIHSLLIHVIIWM